MSLKFIKRLCKHLFVLPNNVRRHFTVDAMRHIEAAIASNESTHAGEICFVVESHLHVLDIFRRKSAKKRAIEVFSQMHVWDTEHNNGVLIYLLLADHDFEILADRGIHQQVGAEGWEKICQQMESMFRQGQFEAGVLYGITQIGQQLAQYYPANINKKNELSNAPIII
jgi:hypothetical protein